MGRRRKALGVAAIAAAAVGMAGLAPASADPPPDANPASAEVAGPPGQAAGETKKVTLITGDQVWLTRVREPSGTTSVTTRFEQARRPGGERVSFAQWGTADEYYVVPSDVLDLVGSRVDKRIFDVAGLIDSGANESSETRVIVSFEGSAPGLAAAASAVSAQANATDATVLSSANAVGLKVPAGKGRALFDQLETASSGRAFVSLDGRFKAMDTTSMPQIGATKAWKSGYTGKGIKVAVLDTGIDDTHPDLKGQVAEARDFSHSSSPTDLDGHGTHVASIIAGTGKVGGPGMRGVAYEAKLLNGKVVGDDGYAYDSDIVKAMEWAVKGGADVINMSLGTIGPGKGNDAVERSVNALSNKYGVVFAVAAGNNGADGLGTVSSPSTADAAISVAAVNSKNEYAGFSSRGPRKGDGALKPDVAAPGVEILGARSKVNNWIDGGTSPYVNSSGTSMAAPHVAGAAALLAQARPGLSAKQMKSALMGAATHGTGSVWEEGAGVVNIPASIGAPIIAARASLSYGVFSYPQAELKPKTESIKYQNLSSKAVTLKLRSSVTGVDGTAAAGVKLSRTTVRVPARGWAKVDVTVTPNANPIGNYAGAVTAVPSTGHAIRTTLGWVNDVERFDVSIAVKDPSGALGVAPVTVVDAKNNRSYDDTIRVDGQATLRLARGSYYAGGFIIPKDSKPGDRDVVLGVNEQFVVNGDLSMTLGGPSARRMSVKTPRPSKLVAASLVYSRIDLHRRRPFVLSLALGDPTRGWVAASSRAAVGFVDFAEQAMLLGPGATPSYEYRVGYHTANRIPASLAHTVTGRQLATVEATYGAQAAGTQAEVAWYPELKNMEFQTVITGRRLRAPASVTTYLGGRTHRWANTVTSPIGNGYEGDRWVHQHWAEWAQYAPGSTTRKEFLSGIMSPGAVSAGGVRRGPGSMIAAMPLFEDSDARGTYTLGAPTTTSLTAYDGSKKVASGNSTFLRIPIPKSKSVRVVQRVDRKVAWWQTSTTSIGEWTAPPAKYDWERLALMNVRYRLSQARDGSVPMGKQSIGLTVTQHTNPHSWRWRVVKPKTLTVDWSVDGGKTWDKAKVTRKGTRATATFTPKATTLGHTTKISLRVFASDGKGSTVKETMISAYRMSGLPPDTVAPR